MSGAKKKLERRTVQAQMGLSEREKQKLKKKQAQRRNNIIAVVGGVVAVALVVALLVWNTGFIDRHITAVKFTAPEGTVGDLTLTKADMDYFYHQALNNLYSQEQSLAQAYEGYTPSFDPSVSLRTQYIDQAQTMSYHDYFMQQALSDATNIIALSNAAKTAGYTLSEEAQANLDSARADLDAQVQQSGYGTRSNYLRLVYGRTVNDAVFFKNQERSILAQDYYANAAETEYTSEELEAYYAEHSDELDSYDYDYAYFDGTAQPTTDAEGNTVEPTEEETAAALAQAKANADAMLAAIQANTATDDEAQAKDFTTLAQELGGQAYLQTDNAGSTLSGAPFAQWLMDAERVDGDADVFEVEGYAYYTVQFHSRQRSDAPTSADVRHILIATYHDDDPDTADVDESQVPFTDEEITAAHTEAERILQEFKDGEQTAERFGALAEQYSADGRNNEDGSLASPGGLYSGVTPTTKFVPEFLDWIFTADRKAGDTGIVRTDYGYHIMYADTVEEAKWLSDARSAMQSEAQQAFLEEATAGYEVRVNKWYKAPVQESQEPQESQENQEG